MKTRSVYYWWWRELIESRMFWFLVGAVAGLGAAILIYNYAMGYIL